MIPKKLLGYLVSLLIPALASAATYYVQTTNNRWNGNGSSSNPFGSLECAVQNAGPGDVIYLKSGVHYPTRDEVFYWRSGTAAAPIVIQSEPGQWAVLDFSNTAAGTSGIVFGAGSGHIHLKWLEVKNTKDRAIGMYTNNNVVEGCNVQQSYRGGIHVEGSGNRVSYNTVWNTNLVNRGPNGNALGTVVWNAGIDLYNASYATINNNTVHSNYGEGILFQRSNNITVRDNTAHDNYSTNYYIDNSRDSQVFNNTSYSNWYGSFYSGGQPANGIMVSIENTQIAPNLRNIKIYNNEISRANRGIYYWRYASGGMQQCEIYGNTVYDAISALVEIANDSHSGTSVHNNELIRNWSSTVVIPSNVIQYSN